MEIKKEINKIKKFLENHEKRLFNLEKLFQSNSSLEKEEFAGIKKLVKKTGVSEEEIKKLFYFEKDKLTVLAPLDKLGKNDKEKTKNISLLTLLGYKYFFGKDEISSSEIRRNVGENGVSIDNFATHLAKTTRQSIEKKGKIRSRKTTYRLIPSGEFKAKELIKKLSEI